MKYMGRAHFLHGMEIRSRLGGGYFKGQEKNTSEVVSECGMGEAKESSTPFEPESTFGAEEVLGRVDPGMIDVPYRN